MAFCEKTGIEFEAASKRTKNHPTIMGILSDAYRDGWHSDALAAIKNGRAAGFTSIEQFVTAMREAEEQYKLRTNAAYAAESQRKREAEEIRRQRHVTNSLLRSRGYEWQRGYSDSDIENDIWNGEGEATGAWELVSPDHRTVSMKEAMLELAFYEDAKFAHDWLASRGIAEAVPAIEVKRREDAAKAEQAQAVVYTDAQLEYQQEAIPHFIAAGMLPEIAEREAKRLSNCTPGTDFARLAPVRLAGAEGAIAINSDFRYGVIIDDEWFGIEEMMHRYPDHRALLVEYARKNEENSHAR